MLSKRRQTIDRNVDSKLLMLYLYISNSKTYQPWTQNQDKSKYQNHQHQPSKPNKHRRQPSEQNVDVIVNVHSQLDYETARSRWTI